MLMNSRKPQAAAVQSLADLWERVEIGRAHV